MSFLVAFLMSLGLKAQTPTVPMVTVHSTLTGFLVEKDGEVTEVVKWNAARITTSVTLPEVEAKHYMESL